MGQGEEKGTGAFISVAESMVQAGRLLCDWDALPARHDVREAVGVALSGLCRCGLDVRGIRHKPA